MKQTFPITLAAAASTLLISSSALHAADMDDRIESAAAKSYTFKTTLKDDSIKTESKDGAVTLTGTVADASHKSLAEDTVANLPGVTRVDNELVVSGDHPEEHSDTWISMQVKTSLWFHRNVSALGTDVNVKDGVVILTGVAGSLAQKELTTAYAQDIDHVKTVVNDMTIAPPSATADETTSETIDDASITAEVKSSLLSHRATSAFHIRVKTAAGVVTLGGIADNDAEKSLVTKLATDINGVTKVINNLTIVVPVAAN